MSKGFFHRLWLQLGKTFSLSEHVDTIAASAFIRDNIEFKGPNIYILAFAIVTASVGLNINSIPVIIGAMLISPLMGPLFGIGLGLGTNDMPFLKKAFKNLLIMVAISILASCLYFLISPLELDNPTELLARTNPTIYDVMIALFGGFAGIMEISRKSKGTVISGVAIATALMPPLCTAGFGLANGEFSYFLGALYLFFINGAFIAISTFISVKYMRYPLYKFADAKKRKRVKIWTSLFIIVIITPSVFSAIEIINQNNFEQSVKTFLKSNKNLPKCYIYDFSILNQKRPYSLEVSIAGEALSEQELEMLYRSAESAGIGRAHLKVHQNAISGEKENSELTDRLAIQSIYERNDLEIQKREQLIDDMEKELYRYKSQELPFEQIFNELKAQLPGISTLTLSRGYTFVNDSTGTCTDEIIVMIRSGKKLSEKDRKQMAEWLKIRLNYPNVRIVQE